MSSERLLWLPRCGAIALLSALAGYAAWAQSALVGGVRVFWLDDDQMISMRYARHLVEGHGLVWNVGERVEGYSNPLWTLLMALVHALGAPDTYSSLWVKLVALLCGIAVLLLSEQLLVAAMRRLSLGAPSATQRALLLVPLASCHDLAYWVGAGFETPLLTALALLAAYFGLAGAGPLPWLPWAAVAIVPLVRSDGLHVWLGLAIFLLGTRQSATRELRSAILSLLPTLGHVCWRRSYYGDWMPNTYYLKVSRVPGLFSAGQHYLWTFVGAYGVLLLVVLLLATMREGAPARWALVATAVSCAYCLRVGGDIFGGSRFLAHLVPLLAVLALAAASKLAAEANLAQRALGLLVVGNLLYGSVLVNLRQRLVSTNGQPRVAVGLAYALLRNTPPSTRIAVIAAGTLPYFSRRPAVDLLGKCDGHVARLAGRPGELAGHSKRDIGYSLGALRPDVVTAHAGHELAAIAPVLRPYIHNFQFTWDLLTAPEFRERYLGQHVSMPPTAETPLGAALYVRQGSALARALDHWEMPTVR